MKNSSDKPSFIITIIIVPNVNENKINKKNKTILPYFRAIIFFDEHSIFCCANKFMFHDKVNLDAEMFNWKRHIC